MTISVSPSIGCIQQFKIIDPKCMDRLFARFTDNYLIYQSENLFNPIIRNVKHIVRYFASFVLYQCVKLFNLFGISGSGSIFHVNISGGPDISIIP